MYLIVVYSEKGGVGKTSLSHSIAFGAGVVEGPDFGVIFGHTDRREPVMDTTRPYEMIDMRDPQEGYNVLQRAVSSEEEGLFLIDTGANLRDYSKILLEAADLILVPLVDDFDSVRMAVEAGGYHPEKTAFIVNRAPSKYASEYKDFEKEVMSELEDKPILLYPQIRAIKSFIKPEPLSSKARSRLRSHSVKLWSEIKDIFED